MSVGAYLMLVSEMESAHFWKRVRQGDADAMEKYDEIASANLIGRAQAYMSNADGTV